MTAPAFREGRAGPFAARFAALGRRFAVPSTGPGDDDDDDDQGSPIGDPLDDDWDDDDWDDAGEGEDEDEDPIQAWQRGEA